ncbi:MAG: hypothetical protein K0R48_589 [Gammaproteobacteria bacterium]|jgi:hypothetical protein|nr:hypothetical protein [Gammaproteobacteria bacterium]
MKTVEEHIAELKAKSSGSQTLPNLSPYEILGIDENTSPEDIHKQYQKLAKTFHPDRYKEDDGTIFKAIEAAKRNLTQTQEDPTISLHDKEEYEEAGDWGSDFLFASEKVDDYLLEPNENKIVAYDKDKATEEKGLMLISAGYAPYITYKAFLNLNRESQKKLAVLLGKQRETYCNALKAKHNDIDFDRDADKINYDSIDLDSEYLSPENQKGIIYFSHQATLSNHPLFDRAAITTEIVPADSSNLYLSGWSLIHQKPGITSGALELFLTWPREERQMLATAIGNEKLRYSENHLVSIFAYYKNLDLQEIFNGWTGVEYDPRTESWEDWEDRMTAAFYQLPKPIIGKFVQQLKLQRVHLPKEEKCEGDDAEEIKLEKENLSNIIQDCRRKVPVLLKLEDPEGLCTIRPDSMSGGPVPLKLEDEGQEDLCNLRPIGMNEPMSLSFFESLSGGSPSRTQPTAYVSPTTESPPTKRRRMG